MFEVTKQNLHLDENNGLKNNIEVNQSTKTADDMCRLYLRLYRLKLDITVHKTNLNTCSSLLTVIV